MQQSKSKKYFNLYRVVKKTKKEQIVEGNPWFFYSKWGLGILGIILAAKNHPFYALAVFGVLATIMFLFYRGTGHIMVDLNQNTNHHVAKVEQRGRPYSFRNPRTYYVTYK